MTILGWILVIITAGTLLLLIFDENASNYKVFSAMYFAAVLFFILKTILEK